MDRHSLPVWLAEVIDLGSPNQSQEVISYPRQGLPIKVAEAHDFNLGMNSEQELLWNGRSSSGARRNVFD